MRRRRPVEQVDASDLPEALRRFTPADWAGSTAAEKRDDGELYAASHGVDYPQAVAAAVMDFHRRRRQFTAARADWCREHGLAGEDGQPDWHRFGPLLRG